MDNIRRSGSPDFLEQDESLKACFLWLNQAELRRVMDGSRALTTQDGDVRSFTASKQRQMLQPRP